MLLNYYLSEIVIRIVAIIFSIFFAYILCYAYTEEILYLCIKPFLKITVFEDLSLLGVFEGIDLITKIINYIIFVIFILKIALHTVLFLNTILKKYFYYNYIYIYFKICFVFISLYFIILKLFFYGYILLLDNLEAMEGLNFNLETSINDLLWIYKQSIIITLFLVYFYFFMYFCIESLLFNIYIYNIIRFNNILFSFIIFSIDISNYIKISIFMLLYILTIECIIVYNYCRSYIFK